MAGTGESFVMSSLFSKQKARSLYVVLCAFALTLLSARAQALDLLAHKSEVQNIFVIYDLPGAELTQSQVKNYVYKALSSHGDDAKVGDLMVTGPVPAQPGRMEFKTLQVLTTSVRYPSCGDKAVFIVASTDDSGSSWGDESSYMACGYRYEGGYRVDLYASFSKKQQGLFSLGATLAKAAVSAMGMKSEPADFILASLDNFEKQLKDAGQPYSIIEMNPALPNREAVADPLLVKEQAAAKQGADRAKRLAARGELAKLGCDASDRDRFVKAIQGSDEDLVELYVEAGAVDLSAKDATGKIPADYASKPAIKALLTH